MERKIKILVQIMAAITCCFFASCVSATGPNGEKLTMLLNKTGHMTYTAETGNTGIPGVASLVGLGADFQSNDVSVPIESRQDFVINVGGPGGITMSGVSDQVAGMASFGKYFENIFRIDRTEKGFSNLVDGFFGNSNAKIDADVAKHQSTTASKTSLGLAKERGALIPKVNPELVPIEALKSP